MDTEYDDGFYDIIREGTIRSANKVVTRLYDLYKPKTVYDVGCGEGHWGKKFEDLGAEVTGLDGEYVGSRVIDKFIEVDLANDFPELDQVDMTICLEVAEHLPQDRADFFVRDLCNTAGTYVVFSAATPHQGGVGHVNEQWPSYWIPKFAANDFYPSFDVRDLIWNDEDIEIWYRQNLIIFFRDYESVSVPILDKVHPFYWMERIRLYEERLNGESE